MNIFSAILLANAIGSIQPVDPTKGVDFYYTAFKAGHSECLSLNNDTMLCPSNALNERISPSDQIDQEVREWRIPANCVAESENVELCK